MFQKNGLKNFTFLKKIMHCSLNTYYFHDVLGKKKYLNLRKANKQAKFEGNSVSNFLPYTQFAREINKIDISILNNLSSPCSDYDKIPAAYREPIDMILRLLLTSE